MRLDDARTVFLDPDYRPKPGGATVADALFCVRCERVINPKRPYRMVWSLVEGCDSNGELMPIAIHPDDVAKVEGETVALFPIGITCAKKIGLAFTVPPEVPDAP
jgi:hypothetical protein